MSDKKIIIDEDWKAQVEKERADASNTPSGDAASATPTASNDSPPDEEGEFPQASFASLVSMLASQAMAGLGQLPLPGMEDAAVDLSMARYFIDTLGVLEEKTRGNLSPDESQAVAQLLSQLQMTYVEVQRAG